jgi:large subunit ribosomal protein L15
MERKLIIRKKKILSDKIAQPPAVKKAVKQESFGLHNLKAPRGAHTPKRILGRGPGSGHGKTSTRGSKGQTSRAGRDFYAGFEGGQSPLIRRMPKRGFTSIFKKKIQIVNLDNLKKIKEATITPELLEKEGLIKDKDIPVKILGNGEIKNPVVVQAHAFSRKAQDKIKGAGGSCEVLSA